MTTYLQKVAFNGSSVVTLRWPDFKPLIATRNFQVQYITNADSYTIWAEDGKTTFVCSLILASCSGTFPFDPDYSQSQNDTDTTDFETNVKPTANASIEVRSIDGRVVVRNTAASKAKNFNLRIFSFQTGVISSLVNQDANYNALSDITMTCYDSSGVATTDPTVAVKSVLDMEPLFNYEIIGGWIDTPPGLIGGTTGEWWISAIGIPDIPSAYGGSVNFVYPANLELVYTQQIVSDGRASQYLVYSPTYHTNKMRWIIKHPANVAAQFQVYVETFV